MEDIAANRIVNILFSSSLGSVGETICLGQVIINFIKNGEV